MVVRVELRRRELHTRFVYEHDAPWDRDKRMRLTRELARKT
jgi:hypothetical protein